MKNHLSILLCLILVLYGCSNKEQEIEDLIKSQHYSEAQKILNNLSQDERIEPKYKQLQASVNFNILLDTLQLLAQDNHYIIIDSLIETNIKSYGDYSDLNDSLLNLQKQYSFLGADFYSSQNKVTQAYQCIDKYLWDNTLNVSDKQKLNNLKNKVIAGIWSGKMITGKMNVRMKIDPVGTSSFTGRVFFQQMGILSELSNGTFDGVNLSATYSIRVSNYQNIMEGITGVYNKGKLTMTFPIVVTVTNSHRDGEWGVYTTYQSKIVRRDCVMSKAK